MYNGKRCKFEDLPDEELVRMETVINNWKYGHEEESS
jgi:hypothetical protein